MSLVVTGTACIKCSFGDAPVPLTVLPKMQAQVLLPVGTVVDGAPIANVPTFGTCKSLGNPIVAAATLAKFGALTPMPCVPATVGAWLPGKPTVLVGGAPALTNDCKLICGYGGVISVVMPGQTQVTT
jgi:hypothetical protein